MLANQLASPARAACSGVEPRRSGPREQQVLAVVVAGRLNKQIGADLGISEITVKAHRGKVMRKLKARSLAGLAKMAEHLPPASMPDDR